MQGLQSIDRARRGASGLLNARVAEDHCRLGTMFLECACKIVRVADVSKTITGRIETLTVRDDKPICNLKTTIVNANGDACVGGATTFTVPLRYPSRDYPFMAEDLPMAVGKIVEVFRTAVPAG